MYRDIVGRLGNINQSSKADFEITFRLKNGSFTNSTQYPSQISKIKADDSGYFRISLWVNQEGYIPTVYVCNFQGESFEFVLQPGTTPLDFTQLRLIGTGVNVPETPVTSKPTSDSLNQNFKETFKPTSGQTVFYLSNPPLSPEKLLLYVNGIKALFPIDYVIDGLTINWLNRYKLDSVDFIEVYYS